MKLALCSSKLPFFNQTLGGLGKKILIDEAEATSAHAYEGATF
jgi:hypothetical protein